MKKKITSILLSLVMVLTVMPMLGAEAYAEAAAPQAPTNLAWDGTAATWTNPNAEGVVSNVFVDLYNTKDTSSQASGVGGGKNLTYYDFYRSLVPGDTYYFEVCFLDGNDAESLTVRSPNYTVPGSYTKPPIGNLQFGRNGELTWDKNTQYITFYKSVLYEKAGDEWNEVEEANAIYSDSTSYSWAWALQAGKTYKAALVGTQGNVEVTEFAESNEITRNVLAPLETPTGLTMDRGFCQWNPVDKAVKYQISLYSEGGRGILGSSGKMRAFPDGTIYFDASSYLTAGERYYFEVLAIGDNIDYSQSECATSEVFTYTGPKTELSTMGLSYPPSTVEYTGAEIKPAITAEGLVEGRDFVVAYTNNINVGEVDIDISGIGDYKGLVYRSFQITPLNLENAVVELDTIHWEYIGQELRPRVKVFSNAGVELEQGKDYTVEYSGDFDAGTGPAAATITGMGNCTGTVVKTFEIRKLTGWQKIDGSWYFYKADGTVLTNSWKKDSKGWCWLQDDGAMLTNGWAKDTKGWCWIGANGYMVEQTKWIKVDTDWYHITKGYRDQSKWMQDSKGWCYLGSDGAMVTNGWAKDSKGWCWMGADGYWVSNKWVKDGGEWYYIKSNHYMACNEWAKDSGGWMWMNASGKITKSKWVKDGSYWYYLKANGYMATGTQTIDGKTYKFDSSGRWIQ